VYDLYAHDLIASNLTLVIHGKVVSADGGVAQPVHGLRLVVQDVAQDVLQAQETLLQPFILASASHVRHGAWDPRRDARASKRFWNAAGDQTRTGNQNGYGAGNGEMQQHQINNIIIYRT